MIHALTLLLISAFALHARAEEVLQRAHDGSRTLALTSFAIALSERHREHTNELERRSAALLLALPNVERADVRLVLPNEGELPLDRPLPDTRAAVVLITHGVAPEQATVARLLRGLVPELEREHVELVTQGSMSTRARTPPRALRRRS